MKIAVVGCGGIGGVVAGVLASKSLNVVCVEIIEESVQVIREQGIKLEGKKGSFHARVSAVNSFTATKESFDIIIISVKSGALDLAFRSAKDYLCEGGLILTLQNGLEILTLSKLNPGVKIVAGAVGYNSIMLDFGRYFVTSNGGITIGNLTCATRDDLLLLRSIFEPHIKIETTENIIGVLWAKLLIVCGVTGLGGASGLLLGKLLRRRIYRKLFYKIITEGVMVAHKLGVHIEKFGSTINPEKFVEQKGSYPLFVRWLLLKLVGFRYKNLKSNIHQSLEKGQPTEIDYLNGKVVRLGEETGILTPVNKKLMKIVKEIEEKKRVMDVKNLYEIGESFS
jgi:2-dehydropantoate 2-reductase